MTASKKLISLQNEVTALLIVAFILLVGLSSLFLWMLYSYQSDSIFPNVNNAAIALLDKKHTLLAATPSFKTALLPDLIKSLPSKKRAGVKHGVLTNPLLNPTKDYTSYRTLQDDAYSLIMSHDRHSIDVKMQQFFFWGIGGFFLFCILLVITITLLIRRRITRSITDIIEKNVQTESAERAKSEFLACVSHELRTPLNAVIGYSEMLKGEVFGALGHTKYSEYVDNIHTSGNHLLKMINDILEISRTEAGMVMLNRGSSSISQMIGECIAVFSSEAEQNGVEVRITLQEDIGMVWVDAIKLKQAITHIIANAIKFTPSGGVIHVHVNMDDDDLHIRVEDTGMGMSDEELTKAMQGYFSQVDSGLDRRFEGMGLGLSFARKLVELHGGELRVDSIKNKGTTVDMSIPSSE